MYKCFQSVCVVVGRWDAKVCEIEGGIFAKELIEISDWEVRRERERNRERQHIFKSHNCLFETRCLKSLSFSAETYNSLYFKCQ